MRICEWSSDVCSSDLDAPVLALLPGSRLGEISRLGAPFLAAAAKVAGEIPGLQAVIPAANAACRQAHEGLLSESPALDPRPLPLDGPARHAAEIGRPQGRERGGRYGGSQVDAVAV